MLTINLEDFKNENKPITNPTTTYEKHKQCCQIARGHLLDMENPELSLKVRTKAMYAYDKAVIARDAAYFEHYGYNND